MPTSTFTPDMPKATQTLAITQQPINDNFLAIDDSIGRNHEPPSVNTAKKGKHKFVEFEIQAASPAPVGGTVASDVIMYTRSTTSAAVPGGESEIRFKRNGGNSVQLTGLEPNVTNSVYNAQPAVKAVTFLPGKLLLQYGYFYYASGSTVNLLYDVPFSAPAYTIQLSIERKKAASAQSVHVMEDAITGISTSSPTGFSLFATTTDDHFVYWTAIGPA